VTSTTSRPDVASSSSRPDATSSSSRRGGGGVCAASTFSWRGADPVVVRRGGLLPDQVVVMCGSGSRVGTPSLSLSLYRRVVLWWWRRVVLVVVSCGGGDSVRRSVLVVDLVEVLLWRRWRCGGVQRAVRWRAAAAGIFF
jgi:hypothetical protein